MKKLTINITKAQLVSFGVELKDGKPEVNASIALFTDGGKPITTYSILTDSWHENKFELPVEAMPLIGDLARILEVVVVGHARDSQLALPATSKNYPKGETKAPGGKVIVNDSVIIDDSPINLDDIPF